MKKDKESLYHNTSPYESETQNPMASTEAYHFTITRLFLTWMQIGFTSFGGGSVTQYLIQENFIYKYKWITAEEYANIIGMSQIAPGVNIISYTILIGKRLAGGLGVFVSLMGLILPSAAVTIGISAIYTSISKFSRVHSALNTGFAAIFGIALATNWRNAGLILAKNRKRGSLALGVALGIMIISAIIYIFVNPSVIVLYLFGGLCGALLYWYISRRNGGD